jgi:hypothetical protein
MTCAPGPRSDRPSVSVVYVCSTWMCLICVRARCFHTASQAGFRRGAQRTETLCGALIGADASIQSEPGCRAYRPGLRSCERACRSHAGPVARRHAGGDVRIVGGLYPTWCTHTRLTPELVSPANAETTNRPAKPLVRRWCATLTSGGGGNRRRMRSRSRPPKHRGCLDRKRKAPLNVEADAARSTRHGALANRLG